MDGRNPDQIIIEDAADESEATGTNTPAGEPGDDFFSSWDKPSIKRPSNPPSRTGTPLGTVRSASPFLNPNGNGNGNNAALRPKSPLVAPANGSNGDATAAPAPSRAIPASAIRKTGLANRPKANILGAKKKGLGAKKVDASALDFDEAERKAREEEERKEKLGYDPEETTRSEAEIQAAQPTAPTIHQPTPVSPPNAAGGDVERIGAGVRKLGFGQVGGGAGANAKAKAAQQQPQRMGFGAIGKAAVVGKSTYNLDAMFFVVIV